jgi:hypothetical protein
MALGIEPNELGTAPIESPQQPDRTKSPTKDSDLDTKVQELKRKLLHNDEQLKLKRQKTREIQLARADIKTKYELQMGILENLRQKMAKANTEVEFEEQDIAERVATIEEIQKNIAEIELKRSRDARKASRLDIEDWEYEDLSLLVFANEGLEGKFQAWLKGKATPAEIRHVKSTLFDELIGDNDLQVKSLLTRLLVNVRETRASFT